MRARKTAIAAATCALVLLPAASAMAGSGPAPAPGKQAAAASTAPSAAGNPLSARAQAANVCSDAHQIGTTAYINRGSAHVASVKQFYSPSCNKNYGYLWIWDSYHTVNSAYDITIGVYSYTTDSVVGQRSWKGTNAQEFWSDPASTVSQCTAATGSLREAGDPGPISAWTDKRC